MKRLALSVCCSALLAIGTLPTIARAATPPNVNVRGTVASSTATSLTITTPAGPMTVSLTPKTGFAGATAGSIADITPGKFLGIASVPGSGANKALEVVVFAESMRGVGEGDYPWDSPTPAHHSTMTNGTVSMPASHSTMTNATVGTMSGTAQKTITMNYKGGSRTLIVPVNAPVVRVAPGTKALLKPGSSVFAIVARNATSNAAFVIVGEDGVKLPM